MVKSLVCARNATPALDISDCGPRAAVKKLACHLVTTSSKAWMDHARLQAILGSCALSLPSVRSGLSCYIAFAGMCSLWACDTLHGLLWQMWFGRDGSCGSHQQLMSLWLGQLPSGVTSWAFMRCRASLLLEDLRERSAIIWVMSRLAVS